MFKFSFALLSLIAATASGAPAIEKRIAQTIADSTAQWQTACLAAGGGLKCNPQSIAAFSTLLAAAGPCDQQDQADNMIDLAKTLSNNANVIKLTQIFAQQPRNTPTSQSVPYCQNAPRNAELNGLFQCQFAGANPKVFVGGTAVGGAGTIPLGHNAPLSPPGSCPANPGGPIPDGQQLVDITQNPGVPASGSGSQNASPPASSSNKTSAASTSGMDAKAKPSGMKKSSGKAKMGKSATKAKMGKSATKAKMGKSATKAKPSTMGKSAVKAAASPSPSSSSSSSSSGNFHLQNGKDAQQLNAQFATLTASSPCTAGEDACVGSDFAQCVDGKFSTEACAGGTSCFALPLVNKPGTSVTCTTSSDATARIAATGATGSITGS